MELPPYFSAITTMQRYFYTGSQKILFLVNFQKLKMQCIFLINQAGSDSFVYDVFKFF